jgi:hypothetical protein
MERLNGIYRSQTLDWRSEQLVGSLDKIPVFRQAPRRLSADDEKVEKYMEVARNKGEPLFVKNLENVQGDERDFIFLSMTYGPAPGAIAPRQIYGPIDSKEGHRRLPHSRIRYL